MNVRRRRPFRISAASAALAGTTALGLVTLSACSMTETSGGGKDGELGVVASFYPLQYLAEQIGKDHVAVTPLTKPGVEPHELEISPQQTAELSEADMVLYLKGLQPAVDDAVGQSGVKDRIDAGTLTKLERHGTEVGHDHGGEEHGGEHDEEGEHGHEESEAGTDPHIWLDPVKYAEVAKGVGKALEKADPDNAADYEKNTAALVEKLEGLDKDFESGLKNRATDTFITSHSAFGYLAERYGLDQEAISGLDPESEPSLARRKELQEIAEKDKVSTVFFETLVSDRTAKTLANDAGLRTDVLDPVEGITDASKGDDYLGVMRSNLKALQKALGTK